MFINGIKYGSVGVCCYQILLAFDALKPLFTPLITLQVTEDGLDDDEAVFKRHVARLAETKSMKLTAPIRVQDVIRKNEVRGLTGLDKSMN